MAGTTRTTYDAMLKDFYEGPVRDVLNSKTFLLSRLKRDSRSWSGRQIVKPVNVLRNQGIGARSEGGTLPGAQEQGFATMKVTSKYQYGRFKVSGPVMASSRGDKAFAPALGNSMKSLTRDLMNDLNRQIFNDASGVLCQVNGAVSNSTKVTVDAPGARYLARSMKIDTYSARTGGSIGLNSVTISAVNSSVKFTLTAAATATNNHFVIREDAYANELMGLLGIVDTGLYARTLFNIDRNTQLDWKANVLHNSGTNRSLTLALMQTGVDAAEIAGNGEIDFLAAHTSVRREYINLLAPDVRFVPTELRGGMRKLTFAGGAQGDIPFEFDKDCTYNRIYFLSLENFTWDVLSDFHFDDETGAILKQVADTDEFEGWLKGYVELECDKPNAQSVLTDISATVTNLGNYQVA